MRKTKIDRRKFNNPNPATRWKKGQSGNPEGPRPGVVAKKLLKEFTQATVAASFKKYMDMPIPELRSASDSLTLPAIEVIVARAILRDRLEGELFNTQVILDRAIGKVPIKQEFAGVDGVPLVPPQIIFETGSSEKKQEGMGAT